MRSNNTNKLSPQEQSPFYAHTTKVQIIQINLVLKNSTNFVFSAFRCSNNTNKLSPQEHTQ